MDNHAAISAEYAALCHLLQDWVEWSKSERGRIGYPKRAAGFVSGGLKDFDDMWDSCFHNTMVDIKTSMSNLEETKPIEHQAILYGYGVTKIWVIRSNRSEYAGKPFAEILQMAHESLIVMVKRKGVVL